jgi:type I restriction enzyme S subunit
MSKKLRINQVVASVSITHKFNKPILKFLNTSDVENGKIININLLPISELKGQAKKTIKKNDILFSEIRPKNKRFAYVDVDDTDDYVVSTKLMVLRNINPEVDNKYFYYFLTNNNMLSILQNRAENRIGSFPQITFDLLSEYSITVPKLSAQQKITSILSTLDSKIELNNKINTELETMAKTLYDYWFVQFDFPDENGKPYKSSGGAMVYNQELKRHIPKGWEVDTISNRVKTYLGGTPSRRIKDYWENGNISWLSSGEIAEFPILCSIEKISDKGLKNSAAKLLKPGSIMVSITGNIRASILGIEASANQSVVGIEESKELRKSYLYFFILNHILQYEALMTGAVQKHINKDVMNKMRYIVDIEDSNR